MTAITRTATILLGALAIVAPASADGAWTIKGRGFGHGVGLSQYGAFGYAEHGSSYEQILDHYFTRTRLGEVRGAKVRVLLGSGAGSVGFSGATRACGERLAKGRGYSFAANGRGVVLRSRDGRRLRGCGPEGEAAGHTVRIAGYGRYRGGLVARADGGSLQIINAVGVEGYVKGVAPNEVPSSWPAAALRAQAVVARSYGLATSRDGAFDHYADSRSQVYEGRGSETPETNRAVKATRGQVVKYRGEVAVTYYFSTSGGQTENAEFGFPGGEPVPYLKSVKDPYDDASPVHRWTQRLSDNQIEAELAGLFNGRLQEIEITQRGVSPRIVRARVIGTRGSTNVTGDTLRDRLGLRSTWARFRHR
ncbi:MAG: SpoIID/LytB domain-containing protein [Solirubrobacterales bacterium]|nr:SpoIID/LytB domain-containing protein [Solirubrobacterales bacterium]